MKKLVLAVIVALFSTTFAFQSNASIKDDTTKAITILKAYPNKPNLYTLIYTSENKDKIKVDIYDQKGNHLKSDVVANSNGFQRSYDFSSLSKGKYLVRVKDQNKVYRTTINHLHAESDLKVNVSPLENGSKYNLQVIHNSTNPVWVNIYNSDHKIIFRDKIDVDRNFSRVYDLGKYYGKAQSIEVYTDGKSVTHSLN